MLVPPSFLFAIDLSCGVTSCHSCGVMLATAQLCSHAIFFNPSIVHHQLILCLQLHNCAVVRPLLKSYAIFVIPALPNSLWCSSIDPLSATAQLCSCKISPKVVRDFCNPSIVHHQFILCLQLHNCAVVRSLLKLYAIFVIPALPRLAQILPSVKQW